MKKIAIVWGITLILVFGGLTFFGFKYQEIKVYKELENRMEYYAAKYLEDNKELELKNGEKYQITLDELKAFRPKINFKVDNDTCNGYVKVTKTFLGYHYQAVLKCHKY